MKSLSSSACHAFAVLWAVTALQAQIFTENFDYPDGELGISSAGVWAIQTAGSELDVAQGAAVINQGDLTAGRERVSRNLSPQFSATGNAKAYFSFTAVWTALPVTATGSYFVHLSTATNGTTYYARLGANTDGATEGNFRVAVANANWSQANSIEFPRDLSLNVSYRIVVKYDLTSGTTTLWLDPESEASPSVTATDPPAGTQQDIGAISLRQGLSNSSSGAPGILRLDDLSVGTTFEQVSAHAAPEVTRQPQGMTVAEGELASFSADAKNVGSAQWTRNGDPVPGATALALTYGPATMDDDGAQFRLVVTNRLGRANSDPAILTVVPDRTPPELSGLRNLDPTTIQLSFSEPLALVGALQPTNYVLSGGAQITAATLGSDPRQILLTTTPLTFGTRYTVTLNHLTDRARAANPLPPDTRANFIAAELVSGGVGGSTASDAVVPLEGGGYAVTSGGHGIAGVSDQFQFAWQQRVGNFDQKVRVEGLDLSDVWAQACLMVREPGGPGARFAAAVATPSLGGAYFEFRSAVDAATSRNGAFPVNYPNTWLRLRRVGNTFTGYASFNGHDWTSLGSTTLALPAAVQVGLATAAHAADHSATARFRELGDASADPVTSGINLPVEPPGPSSRKTGLAITEIMFQPAARQDGKDLAFVELFNSNPWPEDVSGYRLDGDFLCSFPAGTSIAGGGFLVVAASPADLESTYGITGTVGPFLRSPTPKGVLRLLNGGDAPAVYLEIPYLDLQPWSTAAAGTGHSLVLSRPSYGEGAVEAWSVSDRRGGSPGSLNPYRPGALHNVVINELLAHPGAGQVGFVEFYNHGNEDLDLGGCRLSDYPGTHEVVLPSPTHLPARGFVSFNQNQLGFTPNRAGGSLYLLTPDGEQILDLVTYEAQEQGIALGRVPEGGEEWYRLQSQTPGAPNGSVWSGDVVINELLYKPLSEIKDDQFIELYNRGSSPVDLGGWQLNHGIKFTFPSGTQLAPRGYLVVARNADRLRTHYPELTEANTLGDYSGSLSGSGERVTLAAPKPFLSPGKKGATVTNLVPVVVEEVRYRSGGRWGHWADGGGSSLELRDPRANRRRAANWADSDETAKAAWTTIEATSRLDLGSTQGGTAIDRLEVFLNGEGECLLDNVEVIESVAGTNLLTAANSTFEDGIGGWFATGDHSGTKLDDNGGLGGGKCLHLQSSDRGDTIANHIRVPLSKPLKPSQMVTLRAHVRWLRGFPEMVLRVKGNYAEASGSFNPPANLGTPGAVNSRFTANAGPAISDVVHAPLLPAAGQPVVVTARLDDPDGLRHAVLRYRIDPAATFTEGVLTDDGTGGDAVANDGIYSAIIPGQPAGTLVAFHIRATDASSEAATSESPEDAPAHEYLVRFGEPATGGGFATYHLWITKGQADQWTSLRALSNERHELTFVYGNSRVIYNVRGKFAGSPYHQGFGSPIDNNCHYSLEMPGDDALLGATSFNKIHAPGNGPWEDDTLQREQTAYWMVRRLGLPWNYRRYVNVLVNGNRRQPAGLMEDAQTPDSDVIDEQFPDDTGGFLYKLQPWFEFADDGQTFDNKSWCTLNNYLSGGAKKLARYRPNYLARAVHGTANNYTNVFNLIDTANLPASTPPLRSAYEAAMNATVNTDEWLRIMAVEHAVGNWDSFLNSNGQNMYAYKPEHGRWTLMIWDYNIVLGLGGYSDGPSGDDLFKTTSGDNGVMSKFVASPGYRRVLWRAYEELANGIMNNTNADPVINARYAAFQAEGITASAPTALKSWIRSRHNYLVSQVRSANAPFAVTTAGGLDFETADNPILLSGSAPVSVQNIEINGVVRPVTWTDVRHWQYALPLNATTNALVVRGIDRRGNPVAGGEARVTVNYTGRPEPVIGRVTINEIQYHAAAPGAEFIELYNSATNTPYDLSRWRLEGAGYTFPDGTVLLPGAYLVLARDRAAFTAAYGSVPILGECPAFPAGDPGELRLFCPGPDPAEDLLVNSVRFRSTAPWPAAADGLGPSLQLIDPAQDNSRPANWTATTPGAPETSTPGRANTFQRTLPTFPPLWINEVLPDNTTSRTDNHGEADPFVEVYNSGVSPVDLSTFHLTDDPTDPLRWAFPQGTTVPGGGFLVIWADGQPEQSAPGIPHTSFRLAPGLGSLALVGPAEPSTPPPTLDQLDYANPGPGRSWGLHPDGKAGQRQRFAVATPGTSNSIALGPTPVFFNEWMADNAHTLTNNATGRADDWFELYNAGDEPQNLSGFFLCNPSTNVVRFQIPVGTVIPARGFLIVWADNNPAANKPGDSLHVDFHLKKEGESLGLYAPDGSLVDDQTFGPQAEDISEGRVPDGVGGRLLRFNEPTPGATNFRLHLEARVDSTDGRAHVRWSSLPGVKYRLVVRDAINAPWRPLANVTAIASTSEVVDDVRSDNARYYEVVLDPTSD